AKETPEDLHQAALPQESEDPFDADEPLLSDILPEKYMEERDEENTCWCVWEQAADGSWRVRYLPPHMSTLWLWPYGTREFIFATRHEPPEPGLIRFGVFDGRSSCILPMSIFGASPQIVGTAKDGSFWGRCSIHQEQGSASGDEAARSTKASSQTICFIGRPARAKELLLLDAPDMSLWIEAMSPSGRCVSGSYARHEPGNRKVVEHGVFLLEECREGYSFSIVEAPGWRLEEVEAVADNGDIFCAGVCTEPAEHCYRLKLPLRVMA
ncbi:MAG TPA: hypothetical protein PLP17_15710, partial [Oligoflexia bacterium]|nr:hypothetical protein [Oligoflexia bacterium]